MHSGHDDSRRYKYDEHHDRRSLAKRRHDEAQCLYCPPHRGENQRYHYTHPCKPKENK